MSMAREKLPPQQDEKLTTAPRHSLHSSKPPPVRARSSLRILEEI